MCRFRELQYISANSCHDIFRYCSLSQRGPYKIPASEVFYSSKWCYGIVNYKPIVPGHVLVIPKRVVARAADMAPEESHDLMESALRIGKVIEKEYNGESLTLTIQDGPMAGQSVAHCHMHIIPRKKGDWANNDDIYPVIDKSEKDMNAQLVDNQRNKVDFEERPPRSEEDMAREAKHLMSLFPGYELTDA